MKYLYVVDHFCPFPRSEYGGIWNVIAEDDDDCFDLITEHDSDSNVEYYGKLRENIIKSPRFALLNEEESRIVDSFTT